MIRTQLIELTEVTPNSLRMAGSASMPLTRRWQSSKVPCTATLCTLGASTVVIWRR